MRPVHAGTGTIGNDAGAVTVAAIPTLFVDWSLQLNSLDYGASIDGERQRG
jgi:hypothetical protein